MKYLFIQVCYEKTKSRGNRYLTKNHEDKIHSYASVTYKLPIKNVHLFVFYFKTLYTIILLLLNFKPI